MNMIKNDIMYNLGKGSKIQPLNESISSEKRAMIIHSRALSCITNFLDNIKSINSDINPAPYPMAGGYGGGMVYGPYGSNKSEEGLSEEEKTDIRKNLAKLFLSKLDLIEETIKEEFGVSKETSKDDDEDEEYEEDENNGEE